MIRPGPLRLAPGACPGGYVVYVYSVPDGRLVMCDELGPDVEVESKATQHAVHAVHAAGGDVCLVFFDGDSGERVVPPGALPGEIVDGWP